MYTPDTFTTTITVQSDHLHLPLAENYGEKAVLRNVSYIDVHYWKQLFHK